MCRRTCTKNLVAGNWVTLAGGAVHVSEERSRSTQRPRRPQRRNAKDFSASSASSAFKRSYFSRSTRAERLGQVVGGPIQIVLRSLPRPAGSDLGVPRLLDASLSVLDCSLRPSRGGSQLALAAAFGCRGRTRLPFTRSNGVQVQLSQICRGRMDKPDLTDRIGARNRANSDAGQCFEAGGLQWSRQTAVRLGKLGCERKCF